ncbi:hypothetical protein E4U53_000193 [Claviceps sorghi]|nr:hypothetical protein E4U53_000193 [Claviceps sorghi]
MRSDAVATAAAAAAASLSPVTKSAGPQPVALNASSWLGIDGNWSTYAFLVGNKNPVNVLFSTSISEFWAVGPWGCPDQTNALECATNRGGIYRPSDSKHWSGLGTWQLGLPDSRNGESGQYGFDTIAASSPITNLAFGMTDVLMSAISSTDYYLGFFGAGIRSGSFGDVVATPPLRQAVSSFGWIPSYSYGYTAGASYRGVVGSATLGGYDAARFVAHDIVFPMNQAEGIPRPRVRGIELGAKNGSLPAGWASAARPLMTYDKTFTAIIDTSTPYLWLPPAVCDEFGKALNMSYNDTLSLYTLTNEQYQHYSSGLHGLSIKFSLSSKDNHDNFGSPLTVPGVVNITLPIRSLVSLLEYPFMNATVRQGQSAVPYFTLRKAAQEKFIIGNAFMQESYLITKYDSGTFSIHQAQFPRDPISGAQLQAITQPPDSPFPPPYNPNAGTGPSTAEMVGIAVGAVAFVSVLSLALFCYRRHRRQQQEMAGDGLDDAKDTSSTLALEDSSRRSLMSRIFSRLLRRRPSQQQDATAALTIREVDAFEAPDCQIFELPAPVPPVELDAGGPDDQFVLEDIDVGTDSTQTLTAYEIARRKLDRQLQGPVPEYSPPADGSFAPHEKIAIPDLQPLQTTQSPADRQSSPVSPARHRGADSSLTNNASFVSEPSPVSARGDWNSAELPSPVILSALAGPLSSGHRSMGHSMASRSLSANSDGGAASTASDAIPPIAASYQRTPIDQSRVVCLGPLPENIQLSGHDAADRLRIVTMGAHGLPFGAVAPGRRTSVVSLGSNFTEEEEERSAEEISQRSALVRRMTHQSLTGYMMTDAPPLPAQSESLATNEESPNPQAANSHDSSESGRIDPGRDLIHVPQVAGKRYSWEDVHS